MSFLNLILVGKTGAGKSSAGNNILGKKEFEARISFKAVTAGCQRGEGEVDGRTVKVVDTPGVADLHVSVEEAKNRVAECFSMCAPGPHAFLLVIKLGRFTAEEKRAANVIREVFGEAALEHTIVLFTHGDQLENPGDIDTLLRESKEITYLLDKVDQRYHVFNNKMDDHAQVNELLNKIDKMVGERGRHYTSEQFKKAEEKRKEEQEMERMRREEEKLGRELCKKPELRILLIGKTTASNRTASKKILKERSQYSDKDECQKINGEVLGRRVSVVETPGLSDACRKSEKEIMHEILSCICLTSPGPHAFVIVEGSREDIAERNSILQLIKDVFGVRAQDYVTSLSFESFYNDSHSAEHSSFIKHTTEYLSNLKLVTSMLKEIDERLEKNGGSPFTSDMYKEAETAIIKEQMKILEKRKLEITKKDCNIKWEGKDGFENSTEWKRENIKARKEAENIISNENRRITTISVVAGGAIGAVMGAAVGFLAGLTTGAAAGGAIGTAGGGPVGAAVGAPAGAVVGAKVGTVAGASKGAAAGVAAAAGIAGVLGATAGGVLGVNRYRLREKCKIQ